MTADPSLSQNTASRLAASQSELTESESARVQQRRGAPSDSSRLVQQPTLNWVPKSLASYAEIPFRHKRTIVTAVLVGMLLGWLAILVWPRKYRSEAKLKIRIGRSGVALDPTVTTGETMLMQKTLEEEVITTLDVLGSRQVLQNVVEEIGPEAVLDGYVPTTGEARETPVLERIKDVVSSTLHGGLQFVGLKDDISDDELAVMEAADQLTVYAPKKSSVITVIGQAKSPEMAQLLAKTMTTVFMKEHLRSSGTPGSLKFFAQEVKESEDRLRELVERRCEFMTSEKMVSVDANRAMLRDKLVALNRDVLVAKASLEQTRAKATDLNGKIKSMEDEIVVSRLQASSDTWSGVRQRVYELEVAERNMSAVYQTTHPTLVNTREQLESAREIMEKIKSENVSKNSAINPAKANAKEELRQLEVAEAGFISEIAETRQEQKLADAEVERLLENERKLVDLNRDIAVLESNLGLLNQKMEESRLIEQLEQEQFSNVSVVQPASLIERPTSPQKSVFALGFTLMGGLLGLVLAHVKECCDSTVRSTDQLKQWLGGKSIAEIPKTGMFGSAERNQDRFQSLLLDTLRESRIPTEGNSGRVIGVLGCHDGCGSTTVAKSLAESGRREFFPDTGLLDWSDVRLLNDDKSFDQWDEKLTELCNANELVIVDLPPAKFLYSSQILDKLDQVVIVVESEVTTKGSAKRTIDLAAQSASPGMVSVVLNKSKRYMPKVLDRILRPNAIV